MASTRAGTLLKVPPTQAAVGELFVNQRSTRFSQLEPVGMKCK